MKKKIILTALFSVLMVSSVSAGEWKCTSKGSRTYCTYTSARQTQTANCGKNCTSQTQNTTSECKDSNCNSSYNYNTSNSTSSKYINDLLKKYYSRSTSYFQEKTPQSTIQTVTETATQTTTQQPQTASQNTNQPQSTPSNANNSMEQQVVSLVNVERAKYGLSALTIDPALSRVAQVKSEDMRDNNYFSHTSPTYGSPFDMMKSFGIKYSAAGENIAKGQRTAQAVVNAWMNSEGHRANILSSSYTKIGVGYATGNGSVYWSQMFTR